MSAFAPLPHRLAHVPTSGVVGRSAQQAALAEARREAFEAGSRRMVLVTGEAGIGKTTLVADCARRAHEEGALVLHGRCVADLGLPYLPFVEALRGFVETAPDQLLGALSVPDLVELSRLVEAVRRRWPELPSPGSTDRDTERYLLFGAVTSILGTLAARGPVLVAVEDVHWADTSTVLLMRHLVAALGQAPVLIVATGRDQDPLSGDAVAAGLAELCREPGVDRMALGGLDEDGMLQLLEQLAGHPMDRDGMVLAAGLRAVTGGNPFFTTATLEHLAETGVIAPVAGRWSATIDVEAIRLPETVRDVMERRVRLLDEDVRPVLDIAAVLGHEVDLDLLAALLGADEGEVLDALERACDAGILAESADRIGRFGFTHALVQHTLYEGQSRTRRARRHRQVAELLEHLDGGDDAERAAQLAHHWSLTADATGAARAAHHALRAGLLALDSLAPESGRAWFQRALDEDARADRRDPELQLDARIGLGEAQRQVGDPAFRETLISAAMDADVAGDVPRMVRAVLANQRGLISVAGQVDDERVGLIERAVAAVGDGDSIERARLLALLSAELTFCRDHERVRSIALEAEGIARRVGDPDTLLRVLNLNFLSLWVPTEVDRTRAATIEALALAERLEDPVQHFLAATNRLYTAITDVDRPGIDEFLAMATRLAERVGQPFLVWRIGFAACMPPLLDGEAERAEALSEAALDVGVASGQPDAFVLYGANLGQIRLHQGRLPEVLPLLAELAAQNPGLPGFAAAHAMMLAECGSLDEARALLDDAMAVDLHHDAYDYVWSTTATLYADAAATTGHLGVAEVLYDRLAPFAELGIASGPTLSGTVGMYTARLASLLGHREEAEAMFARADEQLTSLGAVYFRARNALHWAEHLKASGSPADAERAQALIAEAREAGERYRCPAIVERAIQLVGDGV